MPLSDRDRVHDLLACPPAVKYKDGAGVRLPPDGGGLACTSGLQPEARAAHKGAERDASSDAHQIGSEVAPGSLAADHGLDQLDYAAEECRREHGPGEGAAVTAGVRQHEQCEGEGVLRLVPEVDTREVEHANAGG